jgi:hypothetical protein
VRPRIWIRNFRVCEIPQHVIASLTLARDRQGPG